MHRPIAASLLLLLVGSAALPGRAPAQVVIRPDSAHADSLARQRDTVNATDEAIKNALLGRNVIAPLPLAGVAAIEPDGTRRVFTRDSIDWMAAQTVSDLLATVNGVFLHRGGGFGRPEMPSYRGLGAGSVRFTVDGMPYSPVAGDTLAVDPSLWALSLLDRIEVIADPGMLHVQLWTRRHDRQAPRTKVGIAAGDRGIARYMGSFERRYTSGWGLTLGADYFGINGSGASEGASHVTNGLAQISYLATPHLGLQAQLLVQSIGRDVLLGNGETTLDTLTDALKGTRTDGQLRASWRSDPAGLGARLDLIAGRTTWRGDSLDRTIGNVGAIAAYRRPTWSAEWTTWHQSQWTSLDSRLALGWAPVERLSASVEAVEQRHTGDRNSAWATARVGLRLPFGVVASGVISDGHRVQVPSLLSNTVRGFTEYGGTLGIARPRVALDVGYLRNDAWQPVAFPEFRTIPAVGSQPKVEWASVHARLAPIGWLTLESRYDHPLKNYLPEGTPPHHALTTATISSRFLHNFPSGIFRLKVQGVMESWSPGIAGRDTTGAVIPLGGATYFRGILQLQVGPFIAFYDRSNMRVSKAGYVPGYRLPSLMGTFGVRWEFDN